MIEPTSRREARVEVVDDSEPDLRKVDLAAPRGGRARSVTLVDT